MLPATGAVNGPSSTTTALTPEFPQTNEFIQKVSWDDFIHNLSINIFHLSQVENHLHLIVSITSFNAFLSLQTKLYVVVLPILFAFYWKNNDYFTMNCGNIWQNKRVFPKIDFSGNVDNKGLCREEQNKFSKKS